MIKLAEKPSPGRIGGEVVGCRAAKHREKASGIDEACQENRPIGDTRGDAHQRNRADHAGEIADRVYDSVCCELDASILREPSRASQSQPNPSREFRRLVSKLRQPVPQIAGLHDAIQPYRAARSSTFGSCSKMRSVPDPPVQPR